MQSYNARFASYTPHRSKSSSKGTADLKWPHPASFLATPSTLASAGFYFNPSAATPDAVSCFMCDKGLADWDPEDDPAEIHIQKCPKCPWAMLKCVSDAHENESFKFASSRLPSSRSMEKARLATFGPEDKKWWPHDAKRKGPTSKMMAKAGFIYSPANTKDDTCMCIYCGIELGGWEPEDDPMEEHRARQAKKGPCPFFKNSGGSSESTKRAQPKTKPPLPSTPTASSSDQEYHPPGTRSSTRLPSNKQPGHSAKSKTSGKSSKKALKVKKAIEEEVVAEYRVALDEDEDAPPKPRPKPRRANSRSRSGSRSRASSTRGTTTDGTDVDGPSAASASTPKKRPKSKSLDKSEDDSSLFSVSVPAIQPFSKSFQSPEDQEFAREEQALEEQARQLMLANTTLADQQPLAENGVVKSHHNVTEEISFGNLHRVPSVDKGKGKAKVPVMTPSTPLRTTPIAKTTLSSVVKFPQLLPQDCTATLTEAERAMTVEQWVRHEMDRQYERLKTDGREKIDAFKARAIEVAKQIEDNHPHTLR